MVLVSKTIFFTAKIEIITLIFNKRKELFFTILANLYHPFKEKRLCASLEAFHHLLTSPLTTVFTLGGIEGVTVDRILAGGVVVEIGIYRPWAESTAVVGTGLKRVWLILVEAALGEQDLLQLLIAIDGILHP